jgi:hypothetical protein
MVYRGAYGVVLALHVLTVAFVIGPLAIAALTAPRLVRGGAGQLPALRATLRATRSYAFSSVVTVLLGTAMIGLGDVGDQWEFTDPWIMASYALWLVAVILSLLVVAPGIQDAIAAAETGADTKRFVGRIAGAAGAAALAWVAIIFLMVLKPGA